METLRITLMSNKVALRSYSYFFHFLHSIYWVKWFLQLCTKLLSFVRRNFRRQDDYKTILCTMRQEALKVEAVSTWFFPCNL